MNDWLKITGYIKAEISTANFKTWFAKTRLESLDETSLTISVPSAFIKGQLLARYQSVISDAVKAVLNKELEIKYSIDSSLSLKTPLPEAEEEEFELYSPAPTKKQTPTLDQKYTLDSFVVGLTNNLAYAAAQAVVQNPGVSYNPLFIYGPSGVGKTHLMQAIGNALLQKGPSSKLIFVSSEKFVNDHVESIQTKKTGEFRSRYRSADILLIDDIQFIAGKESTQEEFFHTYNELHSKNTQIVLTSDRTPQEMQKLESRLASRFQGGLMVDIQVPDFETRIAILKTKLKERNEQLDDDIISLIAERIQSNARELEGKLIQVLQLIKAGGGFDAAAVDRFLGKQLPSSKKSLDQRKVLSAVNKFFDIKMTELLGPRRQKELVLPRQLAMYILYNDCHIPMEKIGEILGGRDHTTIMHGINKIKAAIGRDREVERLLIEVKNSL